MYIDSHAAYSCIYIYADVQSVQFVYGQVEKLGGEKQN